jgi:glycosyltransferase involved in cell wall biosynthesis
MTVRLAYLVTHPIQYQAPLLRRIAADPDIHLSVMFGSDFSVRSHVDAGFGQKVEYDVPLLDGYESRFLPLRGMPLPSGSDPDFWRPWSAGLNRALSEIKPDALWVHGYHRATNLEAMLLARLRGIPVLLRDEATLISAARSAPKRLIKQAALRTVDKMTSAFLAIGSLNHAFWRSYGVPESKLFDMPYAVDNSFFQNRIAAAAEGGEAARKALDLEPGRPVILFVGKLIDRKRPLDLLRAYAKVANEPALRSPYLLVAGSGPLMPQLEQEAKGLPGVRLLGFQNQTQLAGLYGLTDLFVLPSERESWGLVVNEAMNAGVAVIASDRIGAAADLVQAGVNGFTYPVGDAEALSVCLRTTLGNPQRLKAMGAASKSLIDRWGFDEDIAGLKAALAYVVK